MPLKFRKTHRKTPVSQSRFLMKLEASGLQFFSKSDSDKSSCNFCKDFKNTYFKEHLRTATFSPRH